MHLGSSKITGGFIQSWAVSSFFFPGAARFGHRSRRRKEESKYCHRNGPYLQQQTPATPPKRFRVWCMKKQELWQSVGMRFSRVKNYLFSCNSYFFTLFFNVLTLMHALSLSFSCSRRMFVQIYCRSKLKLDFSPLWFPSFYVPAPIWQENGQEEELCLTSDCYRVT